MEAHHTRYLVIGHMFTRPLDQSCLIQLHTMTQHHARTPYLAHTRVGYTDYRHLGNARMLHQAGFYLSRVTVETTDDKHVFKPVGDAQIARGILLAYIPGVQPAFTVDGLSDSLRVFKVALHHMKTAQADLPRAARR